MALSDDYTQQLINLAPKGPAWPTEQDTTWYKLLNAAAQVLTRVHNRSDELVQEIFPDTTSELLPDWERFLGIPDECSELGESTSIRRANVVAKYTWQGGAHPQFFIDIGLVLGYEITVSEFFPFRVDESAVEYGLYDETWAYTWQINSALNTITPFRVGLSKAGDQLRSWGNDRLECFFNRIKPAHTHLLFAYS